MEKLSTFILCLLSLSMTAQTVDDFTLTNVLTGKPVSLRNYASDPGVIVIFTMNNCPFDEYYAGRISDLSKGKLPVLLVNAHPDESNAVQDMIKCTNQRGISTPYLADTDQKLMNNLGAHKSTEAFLLKNNNGKFSVYYHGAIDDNPQMASDVKHAYLQEAVNSLLAGQTPANSEVRPVGCNIRKK